MLCGAGMKAPPPHKTAKICKNDILALPVDPTSVSNTVYTVLFCSTKMM